MQTREGSGERQLAGTGRLLVGGLVEPEVFVGARGCDAAARRASQQSLPDQVRFEHVLERDDALGRARHVNLSRAIDGDPTAHVIFVGTSLVGPCAFAASVAVAIVVT